MSSSNEFFERKSTVSMSTSKVVPIEEVQQRWPTSKEYFVRKMREVLQKQGQIEPLQVCVVDGKYVTFDQDPWGESIIAAAKELGWTTLLVVEMRRYE